MYRKRRILAVLLVLLCLGGIAGYVVYTKTVKDYVDCARMLSGVYNADRSDLSFYVTIDTAGQAVNTQFRAVRFPFQNSTATQITISGLGGDYVFYKVNGRSVTQEQEENSEEQNGIPRNFMELIQWGKEIYQSDLEIQKIKDRGAATYTVQVPDEMVQSFMDAYLGKLEAIDLKYSGCKLTLTGNGKTMTDLALQGKADYRVLFVNTTTTILVRARVNALGDKVQVPDVPDYVVKAAN